MGGVEVEQSLPDRDLPGIPALPAGTVGVVLPRLQRDGEPAGADVLLGHAQGLVDPAAITKITDIRRRTRNRSQASGICWTSASDSVSGLRFFSFSRVGRSLTDRSAMPADRKSVV